MRVLYLLAAHCPSSVCVCVHACRITMSSSSSERLSYLLNTITLQVILLFPAPFWGDQLDMFGHVAEEGADRGEAFLFYSYTHISGGALLIALCSGGRKGWLVRGGGTGTGRLATPIYTC